MSHGSILEPWRLDAAAAWRWLAFTACPRDHHRRRWPVLAAGVVLGCLLVATGVTISRSTLDRPSSRLYRVQQVADRLPRDDTFPAGRTVQLWGVAWPCADASMRSSLSVPCMERQPQPVLEDPGTGATVPLLLGTEDWLHALAHRLPVLGAIVPAQQMHWGVIATYSARVQAAPADYCIAVHCYQVDLPNVDPAPD